MASRSPELSDNSQTQIEAFKRNLAKRVAEPEIKRCSRCLKIKPLSEFTNERKLLKSGLVSIRPSAKCRKCRAKQTAAYRARLKAEGVDVAARQREYDSRRDPAQRRAAKREYEMNRRRKEGIPEKGPYRNMDSDRPEPRHFLPIEPIAVFLEEYLPRAQTDVSTVSELTGTSPRRLLGLLRREYPMITLSKVDKILTGLGETEQMAFLYPDLSVGYHVVTPELAAALTNY